ATAPSPESSAARAATPAEIINARGLWGQTPDRPQEATPAQVAAITAREAVASADQRPTSSISASFQALAYSAVAPSAPVRPAVVAATAPMPLSMRPSVRDAMAAMPINTVVVK